MFILVGVGASNMGYSQTTDSTIVVPKEEVVKDAPATGNEKVITGQVLSKADNSPVVGAIVFIKGTNIATETDENGNYSIAVPQENADGTLVVKYEDDTTVELPLATTTNFTVLREEDVTKLETVQIIGYGTQEKEDVTGAISSVKSEDLNRVVVADPAQAIQGRASGVTVTQNTGAPGAPLQIRIRGTGTIGNASPLYVVNGVPLESISFLNANDIESIDILKDASSAAVYGARAANGVVLVTTKKGSKKKAVTTFNYLTGVSSTWKRYNVVEGKEYAMLRNEASLAGGGPLLYNLDTIGDGTNWQDQIFRKGIMNSYHLSTSGGTEKATYYVSGSYLSQTGIVKNSDYDRFNFTFNTDYQLTKRLKLGAYSNVGVSRRNAIYDGDATNSLFTSTISRDPLSPVYSGRSGDSLYAPSKTDGNNPVSILNNQTNREKLMYFLGDYFAEYQIFDGLKAKTHFGYLYGTGGEDRFNARYYVDNKDQRGVADVTRTNFDGSQLLWENSLSYDKTFAEKHKVGALFLVASQDVRYNFFSAGKTGMLSNDLDQRYLNSPADTSSKSVVTGGATENALLSYMGRINYEYDNKYLLTVNMRRDASSRFPEANRWGSFPSMAAGWKISEEEFFEPAKKTISFLKLRASYGKLGNQNIFGGDYPYTTNIQGSFLTYPFAGNVAQGSAPAGFGNKNITWEKVTMSNIALDFGFFRDKLLFSADYFVKKTSDMLIQRQLPAVAGQLTNPYVNYGEVVNKGIELSTEYRNRDNALKYSVRANLTAIKNEITRFAEPIYSGEMRGVNTNITQLGHPIGEFYVYKVLGVVQTPEEAAALQGVQSGVRPGDFKFQDSNNDGKITADDRVYAGNPMPKFTYGINAELDYKGFDLIIFFQGAQGNKIYNGSKYFMDFGNGTFSYSERMLNRWTGPGSTNEYPRVTNDDPNDNRRASTYYIEDGSYLRLKNLQIGYTLPETYTSKVRFQRVRVFVGAQNLLTFTKYSGLDPEIGLTRGNNNYLNFGIDQGGTYPQARTYQLGITASF